MEYSTDAGSNWSFQAGSSTRCRPLHGLTLVELLVVIGIIAVLIAILMPALSMAREDARRAQCASNLHQLSALLFCYANDYGGALPSGKRNGPPGDSYEHVCWISDALHDYLVGGSSGNPAILSCPNIESHATTGALINVYQQEPLGWVIGYNYLGGHSSATWPGIPWVSPQKISDTWYAIPGAPALPSGSSLPLVSDFIFLRTTTSWAPHAWNGLVYGSGYTNPAKFGSQGSNVAYLDGSVQWRHESELNEYGASQDFVYRSYW